MKKTSKKSAKVISVILALVLVAGAFPLSGILSFAVDDENVSVQYLKNGIVQSGKTLTIKSLDAEEIVSGETDNRGIISDIITFSDLPGEFIVSVDENSKTIQKREYAKYLIINTDEIKWDNTPYELASITLSANQETYFRGESLTITTEVKGTVDSYEWYKNGTKISGFTGPEFTIDGLKLDDSGKYTCKVKDESNSVAIESAPVTVTVTEVDSNVVMNILSGGENLTFSDGVAEVAFENGSAEIKLEFPDDVQSGNVQTDITYKINGNTPESCEFNFESGVEEYVCTAYVTFSKKYKPAELSRTLKIINEPQSDIETEVSGPVSAVGTDSYELNYVSGLSFTVTLQNGSGTGDYNVEVVDSSGDIATATATSSSKTEWTVNVSGAGTFKLRVSKLGDNHYAASAPKTLSFKVNKANVENFAFETPAPDAITYNENGNRFTNKIALEIDGIKYSVVSGEDCVAVNENTGEVTILSAGTAVIKAELSATSNYEAASDVYTLTIHRADQVVEFEGATEEEDPIQIYYGQPFSRVANPKKVDDAADGYGYNHDEDAAVHYSIVVAEGEDAIATVDENGVLTFEDGKTGTITVVATLAANDCYNEASSEYTLVIDGDYTVENPYTVSEMNAGENGWYIDDITIVPADGHKISNSNSIDNNDWSDSLTISAEGTENGQTVYVRNVDTGAISIAYEIPSESVKLDKTAPYDLSIEFETEKWYEAALDAITYNYYNSRVVFHFKARDEVSGVKEFRWSDIEGNFEESENPEEGENTAEYKTAAIKEISNGFAISESYYVGDAEDLQEFKGKISFYATDIAGNISTKGRTYIIIDTDVPILSIVADNASKSVVNSNYVVSENAEDNTIEVFNSETPVTCSIIERDFFASGVSVSVNGEEISAGSITDSGDNHYFTISGNTFANSGDYTIELKYKDIFGSDPDNIEEKNEYTLTKQICIDKEAPEISIDLSEADKEIDSVKYYKTESVKATITVEEFKFNPADFVFEGLDSENAAYLRIKNNWQADDGVYTAEITFTDEGNYSFTATLTDVASNASETAESGKFVIDRTLPAIGFSYAQDNILLNSDRIEFSVDAPESEINTVYDKEKVVITVTVTEKNFDQNKVELKVDGRNRDTYSNTVTINADNDNPNHSVSVKCTDIPGNEYEKDTPNIRASSKLPTVMIDVKGYDSSGNELPKREDGKYYYGKKVKNVKVRVSVLDINFPTVELPVERGNYSVEAKDIDGKNIAGVQKVQNGAYPEVWSEGPNTAESEYIYTLEYDVDGRYNFSTVYNGLDEVGSDELSVFFVIDRKNPSYKITFTDDILSTIVQSITYKLYDTDSDGYALTATVKATDLISGVKEIKVDYTGFNGANKGKLQTDESFEAALVHAAQNDMKELEGSWEFIASKNVELRGIVYPTVTDNCGNTTGNDDKTDVRIDNKKPIVTADLIADVSNLTEGEDAGSESGDDSEPQEVSQEEINKLPSANTGIDFYVTDDNFTLKNFKVTFTAKDIGGTIIEPDNIKYDIGSWSYDDSKGRWKISYSRFSDGVYTANAVATDDAGNVSDAFETIFYVDGSAPYDLSITYSTPKLSKVISAVTFNYYNAPVVATLSAQDSISGIKQFDWTYNREKGASTVNVASESGHEYFDRFEREASCDIKLPKGSSKQQYRGSLSFSAIDRLDNGSEVYTDGKTVVIVDTISPTRTVEFNQPVNTVGDFNNGGKAYYDSEAVATIKITEANFYPEDVDIKVNDSAYSNVSWTHSGDVWTGTVSFSQDGHYVLKINYSDRSTNKMEEYVSGEITVDTSSPSIQVSYSPDNPVYSSGDRKYYSENQTATIAITEHNFDPSGVKVNVTAKDITGKDIGTDIGSSLSWKREGDVNTATITYSSDANYTFEISCTDLANHVSDSYGPDALTIDKTPPENLSISYSTSVLDSVIEGVTFGYYNAPVTVTVRTSDNISGVASFTYTYTDKVTNKTESGTIKVNSNGANATASFKVPARAAEFNGDLKVRATDNSGNKTSYYAKNETLIVDTTAPKSEIQLSTPVTTNGGTAYYAGNVTANISIEEANFYPEDVSILVDGNPVTPSNWSSNGNTRTASVVVSSDGSHTISMSYTDRSGNEMTSYESQQFIIDHTPPIIKVTGVKNATAYKDEKVGFTITAQDSNFGSGGFSPKLIAVVQNSSGGFETKDVDLSSSYSGSGGYSLSFDNITEDGVYTLTCTARDFSGNTTSTMLSEGNPVNSITFSVNRNGSVYTVDENTQNIINKYYVQKVDNNIVISELNVDPLNEYSVKLNNKELVKGKDYTVDSSGGNGQWYKYTYTINADNFTEENDYNIVVNSLDSTNTAAYSDIKGAEIMFTVDSTPHRYSFRN